MFRKVSTLLVLATFLAIGACDDEIITDAIPVSDAAAAGDHASEASKEGGDSTDATLAADGGETSTKDGATPAESAAPEGGSNPEAAPLGDGGIDATLDAVVLDAPPG